MMKYIFMGAALVFSVNAFSEESVEKNNNEGFKRVELGAGFIYGETGVGAKIKYQLSDYLVGVELQSIDVQAGGLFGARTRNDDSGRHLGIAVSVGKDWSYSWFHTAVDIGVGYAPGGNNSNCVDTSSAGGLFSLNSQLCDYEVNHKLSIPMSASFVIGDGVGIGLKLTAAFSSLEDNVGLEVVVPFGSYD